MPLPRGVIRGIKVLRSEPGPEEDRKAELCRRRQNDSVAR